MAELLLAECLTQKKSSTNASRYVYKVYALRRQWGWAVAGRGQDSGPPRGTRPDLRTPARPSSLPHGHLPAAASEERTGESGSQASRVALSPCRGTAPLLTEPQLQRCCRPRGPLGRLRPRRGLGPRRHRCRRRHGPNPAAQATAAPSPLAAAAAVQRAQGLPTRPGT